MEGEIYDIAIVGAGPAGIEAALQADQKGLKYILLDKDIAGSLIERTMAKKRFFHEYGRNKSKPTGLIDFPNNILGKELVELWHKQLEGKQYREMTSVTGITKEGDKFTLTTSAGVITARFVVLSSGTFDAPRTLGVPGESTNEKVVHQFDYGHDYGDGPFVVVGGGNSALEAAIELGFDQKVTMVVRKGEFHERATQNNKDEIGELVESGTVSVLWRSTIKEIGDGRVVIQQGEQEQILDFSYLFIHVGFNSPMEFLKACGVEIKDELPVFDENFESSVSGLYIAGSLTVADSVIESANQAHSIVDRITTT